MTNGLLATRNPKRVMNRLALRIANALVLMTLVAGQMDSRQLRPLTVEDCVRTRRVVDQELEISPNGARVAYLVKAPNTLTNRNDYRLYVRELEHLATRENGHLLLQADQISGIRWLGSDAIIARVGKGPKNSKNFKSQIEIVNAATGESETLRYPGTIKEYSASADGTTLVFSVKVPASSTSSAANPQQQEVRDEWGYPIIFGEGTEGSAERPPDDEIFLAKRTNTGKLEVRRLYFDEPGAPLHRSSLRDVRRLDLSPDGKHLLVTHSARSLPPGWADEPYVQYTQGWGTLFHSYVLSRYDVESSRLSLGFNFIGYFLETSWSQDSRSYSVVAPSPFGTDDARAEARAAGQSGDMDSYINRYQHVFVVDLASGTTTRVLGRENRKLWKDRPLVWKHSVSSDARPDQ